MSSSGSRNNPAAAAEVGFVVIGRNEGERLRACLASVFEQCESVVFADSASTDDSLSIARSFGARTVSLTSSDTLTAANGRNAGFKELRSAFPRCRFVHFMDGDCILQDGWLEEAVKFLGSHPEAAVVCGSRFEAKPCASVFNAVLNEEWNTPPGLAESCGGDALMRVSALEAVGVFSPELKSCEEPELCARLRAAGWQIWRLPSAMTEHDAALTHLSQWWRRGARAGFGYSQVWQKTRDCQVRLYSRELVSTFAWAAAVPLTVLVACFLTRSFIPVIVGLGAYVVQIARMAAKRNVRDGFSWRRAALIMIGKFAAATGAAYCFLGSRDLQTSYR